MRTEIRVIQRKVGITTILVTHDIHEAFALSDRIAVLNAGRIEQIGTPAEIYQQPRTRFVAEFAGQSNHFDSRVHAVEQSRAHVSTGHGRLHAGLDPRPGHRGRPGALGDAAAGACPAGRSGGAEHLSGTVSEVTYLGGMTGSLCGWVAVKFLRMCRT